MRIDEKDKRTKQQKKGAMGHNEWGNFLLPCHEMCCNGLFTGVRWCILVYTGPNAGVYMYVYWSIYWCTVHADD